VAPARATLVPSVDLGFRAAVAPDSVTVGDPITLSLEASAPAGTVLLLPQAADSIGPFRVLAAEPPATSMKEGWLHVRQTVRLTLFRTGTAELPPLPLLAPRGGSTDTLAAWTQPLRVKVGALLQGEADPSNLRDLKKPVPLARPLWWLWALGLAAALAAAWGVRRWWRARRRAISTVAIPAPPPLPPEIAFERGLAALRAERLPERGRIREFYFELSGLFRRYLEDRFGFAAVEETRTEIREAAARLPELRPEEVAQLGGWLDEGDLVKFAKMDRLLEEVDAYTERAAGWVRATAASRVPPAPEPPAPATPVPIGGSGT
jgi:hypothetical protein